LAQIRAPRFDLTIAGVGHFGQRMLWAGIERNPALLHLHDKVESAVVRTGIAPEPRRYAPHITLARLKGTAEERLQTFLAEHAGFRAAPLAVERFSLIASYLTKSGAIYEDQADYPLR
jgi:2'-5' RNA ligase